MGLLMALSFAAPAAATDGAGPEAAWDNALVVIPGGMKASMQDALTLKLFDFVPAGTVTVLFMHGCSGIAPNSDPQLLGRAGFLVIAPDSLKRAGRMPDCVGKNQYGRFPQAAAYRLQEIRYSLTQLPTLPKVDMRKLVLFGHSEGAKGSANWSGHEFRAVVLTGWRCATTDTVFAGLRVPVDVPVMNIVAKDDEWLVNNRGITCAQLLKDHPVKLVLTPEGTKHWMNDTYSQEIQSFIKRNAG